MGSCGRTNGCETSERREAKERKRALHRGNTSMMWEKKTKPKKGPKLDHRQRNYEEMRSPTWIFIIYVFNIFGGISNQIMKQHLDPEKI